MKVSITYLYTITKYGYPPSIEDDFKALADIERLGFHLMAATTPLRSLPVCLSVRPGGARASHWPFM